jgi:probable rRNA maturation factor
MKSEADRARRKAGSKPRGQSSSDRVVVNIQGSVPEPLTAGWVRERAQWAGERVFPRQPVEISLMFCGDTRMRALNGTYRGKDTTTDVLSFPMGETVEGRLLAGDIVISRPRARLDAGRDGMSMKDKMWQLLLHGMLHLSGYDHESDADARRMESRERALSADLKKTKLSGGSDRQR